MESTTSTPTAGNGTVGTMEPPASTTSSATLKPGDLLEIGVMLFQEAESVLRSGKKRGIKLRLGRKTLAEMPLTTGAVGVLVAAMAAVALTRLAVELE